MYLSSVYVHLCNFYDNFTKQYSIITENMFILYIEPIFYFSSKLFVI